MSDYSQFVPEHIRNLGGYTAGKSLRQAQRESRVNCIKMASNENPFGPSPKAVKAMQAVLAESNFYPDNDAIELRQRLAETPQCATGADRSHRGFDRTAGHHCAHVAVAGTQRDHQRAFVHRLSDCHAGGGRAAHSGSDAKRWL